MVNWWKRLDTRRKKKKRGLVLFLRLPLRGIERSTKRLKMRLQEEATQLPLSRGTKRGMGAVIEGRWWWIGVPFFPGRRWGLSRGVPPASPEPEACFCRWAGAAGDDLKAARALLFSEEVPDIFSAGTSPPVWGGHLWKRKLQWHVNRGWRVSPRICLFWTELFLTFYSILE